MPTEATLNEPLRSGRLFDLPTSELPTPSFLRRRGDWVQPAVSALRAAMSFRDQSFVGFRGDLWREWRSGMRDEALAWRQLSGGNRFTLNQGRSATPGHRQSAMKKTKSTPRATPRRCAVSTGSACTFEECRNRCPHCQPWKNQAGGTERDCTHPQKMSGCCQPWMCPVFESEDPDGDAENMRMDCEIDGQCRLPPNGSTAGSIEALSVVVC